MKFASQVQYSNIAQESIKCCDSGVVTSGLPVAQILAECRLLVGL
jgi:hypothetical protein